MIAVGVQSDPIDSGAAIARLEATGGGGVATFSGLVRSDGGLVELLLEHHPGMTEAALRAIAEAAAARWPLLAIEIVHRVGAMMPGERIVFVGTASRHRAAALEACAYLIDSLKTGAPFWKRERFADGATRWVEARTADDVAAARWDAPSWKG